MNEKSKAGHVGELKPQASSNRVIRYAVDGPPGYADRGLALPHVVLVHGFKGFYKWGFFPELAGRIAAAGMVAVRVNLSGCGVGPDLESFSEPEEAMAEGATVVAVSLEAQCSAEPLDLAPPPAARLA